MVPVEGTGKDGSEPGDREEAPLYPKSQRYYTAVGNSTPGDKDFRFTGYGSIPSISCDFLKCRQCEWK